MPAGCDIATPKIENVSESNVTWTDVLDAVEMIFDHCSTQRQGVKSPVVAGAAIIKCKIPCLLEPQSPHAVH